MSLLTKFDSFVDRTVGAYAASAWKIVQNKAPQVADTTAKIVNFIPNKYTFSLLAFCGVLKTLKTIYPNFKTTVQVVQDEIVVDEKRVNDQENIELRDNVVLIERRITARELIHQVTHPVFKKMLIPALLFTSSALYMAYRTR